MKTNHVDCDWAHGFHSSWERHLHGVEAQRKKNNNSPLNYNERRDVVTRFVQKNPKTAETVVRCEFCQDAINEAAKAGEDFFLQPNAVRLLLEQFGIADPHKRRTR